MKLNGIHHVAIICSDYEKSKMFYTETLGLQILNEVYRSERQSYKLDQSVAGKYQIELFSFLNPPKRVNRPEACGLRHLAFEVEDLAEAVDHLSSHGVHVEKIRVDEVSGKKFTFFADPDELPQEF